MTIGEKIKEFRLAAGLTQKEFAKNLDISRYFLSQLENNEKELSDSTTALLLNHITDNEVPKGFKKSILKDKILLK
jgi:transcriptional regulator with XRE-family HTH domain